MNHGSVSSLAPLASPSLRAAVDKTRTVGPDRELERAAEALAHEVLASLPARPSPFSRPEPTQPAVDREAPLPAEVRAWLEPRFGADFSDVRVHTGPLSAELCRALGARAFAFGASVYYGDGLGPAIDALTAHELAHVVQQRGQPPVVAPVIQIWPWEDADQTPARKKAFTRKDELTKRLNDLADPFKFKWAPVPKEPDKFQLVCTGSSPKTRFQKYMKEYADPKTQVIPMRFVFGEDVVCEDSFLTAAVDLDDLMAADDIGFQAILMHLLEERNVNKDYVNGILNGPKPDDLTKDQNYRRSHQAAREQEAALFQDIFHDPTIVPPPLSFCPPSGKYEIKYRSKEGWTIVELIEKPHAPVAEMNVWVVTGTAQKGETQKADDFAETRAGLPPVKPL